MTNNEADRAARSWQIRSATASDAAALDEICIRTGAAGEDATGLYHQPELLAEIFLRPYLALSAPYCFVVDNGARAIGYTVGTLDAVAFEAVCEREWWPALRESYRDASVVVGMRDEWLLRWIQEPPRASNFDGRYPSELHIDLLPEAQGGGWGRRLIATILDAFRAGGSRGVHLGVARSNERAVGFYQHLGFRELGGDADTVSMGLAL